MVISPKKWESFEEPWRQNAASGEFFAESCFSFFATSGVLMSGFFEGLSLKKYVKSLNCWKMNFETLFESRVRVNVRWMGKWIYSSRPLRFEILDEQKISIWRHEPLITGRVVDHHVILPSEFYKWSKRYFLYFYSA